MSNHKPSGTREWAKKTWDIATGCPHDCFYCYSKDREVRRFHRVKKGEWKNLKLRPHAVGKRWRKTEGRIMFPANHDIVPEIIDECVLTIREMVKSWDRVIIVTKPHLDCVTRLCTEFEKDKDKILFRFTIGSLHDDVLKFWEPGAPNFEERWASLKWAHGHGFRTSISSEPFLDEDIRQLFKILEPWVTDTIWIGPMNHMEERVDKEARLRWSDAHWDYWNRVKNSQTKERIQKLYDDMKAEKKVRWKNAIKEMLGLDIPDEIGLDI